VGAHRVIGPAGQPPPGLIEDQVVECLAHAVEPLELEGTVPGQLQDGGHGMGVMGGELGVDPGSQLKEPLGAGEIGQVRVDLARVDRIARQALLLGPLYLAVPVGPLDQAHQDAPPMPVGQGTEQIDQGEGPALIGLDGDPEALPARQGGLRAQGGEEVQAEVQACRLLRVDGEPDRRGLGRQGQLQELEQQLGAHPLPLGRLEAGVQGRELDGDPGTGDGPESSGGAADRGDGLQITLLVAGRVLSGAGRLAEHVE